MRIPKRNSKHDEVFINLPDLTQILQFSPISPYAPQSTNSDAPGPSAMQMASSKPPTPILRKSSKRQLTISDTSDSDTSSVRKSKRTLKKKTSQTIVEKSGTLKVTLKMSDRTLEKLLQEIHRNGQRTPIFCLGR